MKNLSILTAFLFISNFIFAQQDQASKKLEDLISNTNEGVNTDSVIIYKDGKIILEAYANEYNSSTKHLSWSMAKSVAGMLIGIAEGEGLISYSDLVSKYLPHFKSPATIMDILTMSSAVQFKEEYAGVPVDSDATKMLYLNGPENGFYKYIESLPLRKNTAPGHHFYYSSGDTNILMEVLKVAINDKKKYDNYPWDKLFNQLGIQDATFEQDSNGTFVGSSYIYLTPIDFLKIGKLIMQAGIWEGSRIIPESYIQLMSKVAPGVNLMAINGTSSTRSYSTQITTNKPILGRGLPSEYQYLPEDSLLMIGHQGQLIVASPSQKMVIVRLAMDKGTSFNRKEFFKVTSELIKENGLNLETTTSLKVHETNQIQQKTVKGKTKILDYLKVPHLIRAMAAKEYCSCRLVVGRSKSACKKDLKVSLPILPILTISKDNTTVKAMLGPGLFRTSIAVFNGKKLGCSLIQSE